MKQIRTTLNKNDAIKNRELETEIVHPYHQYNNVKAHFNLSNYWTQTANKEMYRKLTKKWVISLEV